jgi:hypothetical protein
MTNAARVSKGRIARADRRTQALAGLSGLFLPASRARTGVLFSEKFSKPSNFAIPRHAKIPSTDETYASLDWVPDWRDPCGHSPIRRGFREFPLMSNLKRKDRND